jgi:hypothetical protein
VVGSNSMWKAKIAEIAKEKRLKLDLVRIFEIFTIVPIAHDSDVTSYGTSSSSPQSFWRENL